MKRMVLLILFCVLSRAQAGGYTQAMFRAALANASTSPDYVLINVREPEDKTNRVVCTTANLFLGAIHIEYELGYSQDDAKPAIDIALHQSERLFVFHKKAAADNLADYETPNALTDVRQQFSGKSDSELLDQKFIDSLASRTPAAKHLAYRDSVAHALLERGIGCRMGDIADFLIPHR